jgi:hypothetical protein
MNDVAKVSERSPSVRIVVAEEEVFEEAGDEDGEGTVMLALGPEMLKIGGRFVLPGPVGIVQFQSCQGNEVMKVDGAGDVVLGQRSDVGALVGIPAETPLAPDDSGVLLASVVVEPPMLETILVAVTFADDAKVKLLDELDVVLLLLDSADEVANMFDCELWLADAMEFERAEMREEFDHPAEEADVSVGENTLVLSLLRTMVMVNGRDTPAGVVELVFCCDVVCWLESLLNV